MTEYMGFERKSELQLKKLTSQFMKSMLRSRVNLPQLYLKTDGNFLFSDVNQVKDLSFFIFQSLSLLQMRT